MNMLFFYLPLFYSYKTRFKSLSKFISWTIIYVLPICYFYLVLQGWGINNLLTAILSILFIYDFYEIGYIQNDAETTKFEKYPTIRLNNLEQDYYEKCKLLIYGSRFLGGVFLSFLIYYIAPDNCGKLIFISLGFSILLIYQVYNKVRSRLTLLLHFYLVIIRFCSIMLLAFSSFDINFFLVAIFLFPIPNLIERSSSVKFKMSFINFWLTQKDDYILAKYRLTYYLLLFAVVYILFFFYYLQISAVIIVGYFLVYRFLCLLQLKYKKNR